MLTIFLITKYENILEKAIKSVLPLRGKIVIGNIGNCNLSKIRREYNAEIIRLTFNNDYSKVRNKLLKHGSEWCFYLEPWEILTNGHDKIKEVIDGEVKSYYLKVLQGDIINKEIRLWYKSNNLEFKNPVFESIVDNNAINLQDGLIYSNKKDNCEEELRIISEWKASAPASFDPYYYQANILLAQGRYDEFDNIASHYLFHEKNGISSILLNYYYSKVQLYVNNDIKKSIKSIIPCLVNKPLMAEFWCLLGDIYYKIKEYKKSYLFYENALILGSRRLSSDEWPIEISKYKEYPEKMMASCQNIMKNSKYYQEI